MLKFSWKKLQTATIVNITDLSQGSLQIYLKNYHLTQF